MGGGASAVQATLGRGEEARGLWGDSEGLTSQDRSLGATCAALAAAAPAAADLVQRGGLRRRESAGGLVLPEPAGLASHAAGGEGVGMGQQADGQGWLYFVVNRCLEHTSVRPGVSVAFMPLRGLKFVVTFRMGCARRCGMRPHLAGS